MSAAIRVKILGGTSIQAAYSDCANVSERLGGVGVETEFNGVEMFFHGQTMKEWVDRFYKDVGAHNGK